LTTIRPELLTATWIIKQIPGTLPHQCPAFRDWAACKILKIADLNLRYTTSIFNYRPQGRFRIDMTVLCAIPRADSVRKAMQLFRYAFDYYGALGSQQLLQSHSVLSSAFGGPRWLTGGTVGPEASFLIPIALLVVALVFSRYYRENRYQILKPRSLPVTVS